MSTEQFSLCWDNFHKNMSMGMQSLLENEDLVDVTLAVEGRYLKAHKMVLSVCSPYFRELFQTNPCKHPIVFMKDVSYIALSDLLHFMYQGEVQVAQENLTTFIKTAEALQIKGLTGEAGVPNESESEVEPEVTTVPETPAKRPLDTTEPKSTIIAKPKRFSGPACKRPKLTNVRAASVSPAPSVVVTTENKYEVDFVNSNAPDDIDLKTEPGDTLEQSQNDIAEESQLDEATEENSTFEMADETEDFSLIESNNDEPKPGTSAEIGDNQEFSDTAFTKLPDKSKKKYESVYKSFMDWRTTKNICSFSENVLLTYFDELGVKYKSSSLWALYSMLRSTLIIYNTINIGTYTKLRAFLKRKSVGYSAKKTKTFTTEEIHRFLTEAPDNIYLATKVAFIIGIMGACRLRELHSMNVDNFQDLGSAMIVTVRNCTMKTRRFTVTGRFYSICKKYADLRPSHSTTSSFFLNYQNGRCTIQKIGVNKFGAMGKQVAKYLKLPNPELYTGHSFRKSSDTLLINAGWLD